MEKVIKGIENFFKKNDWKYKLQNKKKGLEKIFKFGVDLGNIVGSLQMYIYVNEFDYVVLAVLNNKATKENFSAVAEYLHKANYGLKNGNFEMDYNDGEIRYKTYVNFDKTDISDEVIEASIFLAPAMFDEYGEGLLQTMSTGIVAPVE